MKAGIANKISLLAVGLVISTALIISFVFSSGITRVLVDNEISDFRNALEAKASTMDGDIGALRRDVLFLSHLPAIKAIIRARANGGTDPRSGLTEAALKDEVASIFRARMEQAEGYFQLRLIGKDDSGKEMVRIDRVGDSLIRIPEQELQHKGQRDYFQGSIGLPYGKVYLSRIDLNREHGKVSIPHLRTLRIATPLYDEHGQAFGIVIINFDFGLILDRISAGNHPGHAVFITNSQGDFLVHPDNSKTFGFDLGTRHLAQEEMPNLAPAYSGSSRNMELEGAWQNDREEHLTRLVKVFFSPEQPQRFLAVIQSAPLALITAKSSDLERSGLHATLILAFVGAMGALLFARMMIHPLEQVTWAARRVCNGERDITLPSDRKDEIGILSRSFSKMLTEVDERERRIRDKEARLRATLDTVVNGIVTIDEQGIIDNVNPAIERMFGYDSDALVGKNVSTLMPAAYAEAHDGHLSRYRESGIKSIIGNVRELEGKHHDGRHFPILLAVNETTIADQRMFVGAIQDLTALRKSEGRTRQLGRILESSSNEIHIFASPDYRLLECNRSGRNNLGYSDEQLQDMRLPDLFPPSEHQRIEQVLASVSEGSQEEQHLESLFQRRDGSLYPVELRIFPSEDKRGSMGVLIAQDISERQKQMDRLRAYAQRLESSNRELQDFAYVASHDLQEPLRKVQAFGDRLVANEGERLSERGADYLQRMKNAAGRMQILINDLLTLSRVTTKGKAFQPVDLNQIADEVIDDLEARIHDAQGTIEVGNLPTVQADPLQMRQLLQNLLGNALKFHRPDTPPVVRLTSKLVETTTEAPAHHFLTVQDNGIGFDEKYVERIFTPFERLHSRQEYEGTGMGLALCKKIVERHDGLIEASSQPDIGSTFTITLPAHTEV